jgi:hypothetical protein
MRIRSMLSSGWFFRHTAVVAGPARDSDVVADEEAVLLEQSARAYAAEFHVPMRLFYVTAADIAETVLDVASTHDVEF